MCFNVRIARSIKLKGLNMGGLFHPLDISLGSWESISIDFITQLPSTQRGNDLVYAIVDRLTNMGRFTTAKFNS